MAVCKDAKFSSPLARDAYIFFHAISLLEPERTLSQVGSRATHISSYTVWSAASAWLWCPCPAPLGENWRPAHAAAPKGGKRTVFFFSLSSWDLLGWMAGRQAAAGRAWAHLIKNLLFQIRTQACPYFLQSFNPGLRPLIVYIWQDNMGGVGVIVDTNLTYWDNWSQWKKGSSLLLHISEKKVLSSCGSFSKTMHQSENHEKSVSTSSPPQKCLCLFRKWWVEILHSHIVTLLDNKHLFISTSCWSNWSNIFYLKIPQRICLEII